MLSVGTSRSLLRAFKHKLRSGRCVDCLPTHETPCNEVARDDAYLHRHNASLAPSRRRRSWCVSVSIDMFDIIAVSEHGAAAAARVPESHDKKRVVLDAEVQRSPRGDLDREHAAQEIRRSRSNRTAAEMFSPRSASTYEASSSASSSAGTSNVSSDSRANTVTTDPREGSRLRRGQPCHLQRCR